MCGSDPCLTSKDDSATADDFSEWTDFPKGMRVLLLDHDDLSASTISSELQQMDYTVTRFHNEDDALEAVAIKTEAFHVAIVEVNTSKSHESFRFLQMAMGLPTIMISDVQCLNTMMKCIALGAAAFLQKPLSEDKLRNIWQYVVHKAFNARQDGLLSKSLKPIKETVSAMLRLQSDEPIPRVENRKNLSQQNAGDDDDKVTKHMFATAAAAPSTPQQTSHSPDAQDVQAQAMDDHQDTLPAEETSTVIETIKTDDASSNHHRSSDCKSKKKPMKKEPKVAKVDWTPELHRRFIQAVEQLGIYEAIPSKILEHMKVEGLTRHNVASHLQKYRMHRRHVLPQQQREQQQQQQHISKFYLQNPCVAFPPLNYHHQVNHHHQSSSPVWGHPAYNHQTWFPHDTARYQPLSPRIWPWKSFTRMYADNWGFPVVPGDNMFSTHHKFGRNHFCGVRVEEQKRLPPRSLYDDLYVEEEVIDEVVKEAMRKPWLPLPLGLKPPSIDAVLAELQRQGIRTIPPTY